MEKQKTIIFLLFLLFVFLFSYFFLFPKYKNYQRLKREIFHLEKEIQTFQQYFQKLKEIYKKLKAKEESTKAELALPKNPDLPKILNFIQISTGENGLLLKEVSITQSVKSLEEESPSPETTFSAEETTSQLKIGEINLELKISGNYSDFKNFLSDIEKSARLIQIENIEFSAPSKEERFEFKIRAKTFFLPEK